MTTADLHKLQSQNYIYDPRPKERINCSAYQSHFRNTVLGFQTKEKMPVTQRYKPANPYALFSDHQYLQSSEEDLFLQQENLSTITEVQQETIERQTVGQHTNIMFVCLDAPWLAATPDQIVSDTAILEVKCLYVAKDKCINPATIPYLKDIDNTLQMDRNHAYFYQIQGQLLCSNRELCYFCVYTLQDMKVLKIRRDRKFIAEMIPQLQ